MKIFIAILFSLFLIGCDSFDLDYTQISRPMNVRGYQSRRLSPRTYYNHPSHKYRYYKPHYHNHHYSHRRNPRIILPSNSTYRIIRGDPNIIVLRKR